MKHLIFIIITFTAVSLYGQDKYNYVNFNDLIEVKGTEYVIATVKNIGKKLGVKSQYLLFINTKTGASNRIDFPNDSYIQKIEQVKIDSLGINKILIAAKTIDLNHKKGINWSDPIQLIVLSTDGLERTQMTDNNLFVKSWLVNKLTGKIVVVGYYDTNGNGKYNKTDKDEIGIYDLKTLKLITKNL